MAVIERRGKRGTTYSARIYDRTTKGRRWLGTFDTEEEARQEIDTEQRKIKRRRADKRRARPPINDRATSLYRCFDGEGALLYVGITSTRTYRLSQHSRRSAWWAEVARIDLEHFSTRYEAEVAEAELIRRLSPPHNTLHRREPEQVVQVKRCKSCRRSFRPSPLKRAKHKSMCDPCFVEWSKCLSQESA